MKNSQFDEKVMELKIFGKAHFKGKSQSFNLSNEKLFELKTSTRGLTRFVGEIQSWRSRLG